MAKQRGFTAREVQLILNGTDEDWLYYIERFKRRQPALEPYIMKHPLAAQAYAVFIIRGRWPEAEPTIKKNPVSRRLYKLFLEAQRQKAMNPWLSNPNSQQRKPS